MDILSGPSLEYTSIAEAVAAYVAVGYRTEANDPATRSRIMVAPDRYRAVRIRQAGVLCVQCEPGRMMAETEPGRYRFRPWG